MKIRQGVLKPPVHERDHVLGPADAPATLVEYGDYECPYCYQAHPIIIALRRQLGDRMRFVYRNFPLPQVHPHAMHAAEAAESVATHAGSEAYWKMHDAIFEHQQDSDDALDDAHLVGYAAGAGANPVDVKLDLEQDRLLDRVGADFSSGVRSGVNGTPTFFVNGGRFDGDWTNFAEFASVLERAARPSGSRAAPARP